jgi:hypothetical protein
MTHEKRRYSAKEMRNAADVLDASDCGDGQFDAMNAEMLRQAASEQSQVMGLVESIEAIAESWGPTSRGARLSDDEYTVGRREVAAAVIEEIREALSKFRGEVDS